MPFIQLGRLRKDHFKNLRGQLEDLQAILAKTHLKRGD